MLIPNTNKNFVEYTVAATEKKIFGKKIVTSYNTMKKEKRNSVPFYVNFVCTYTNFLAGESLFHSVIFKYFVIVKKRNTKYTV